DRRAFAELPDGIDRAACFLQTPLADAVEVLERKPERVHDPVTARARRVAAVLLHQRAHGLRLFALLVLQRGVHVRWRWRWRRAKDVLEDVLPAQHRRRAVGI